MKVKYIRVLLEKNERFSTPLSIAPWEVPVLIEAQGGGVTEVEAVTVERKARPDAQSEYQRLVNRYRHSSDSDMPYVARVYGVGAQGVAAIEKIIADSVFESGSTAYREAEAQEVSDLDFVSGAPREDAVESLSA